MEEQIRNAVSKALKQIGAPEITFAVERPSDISYGDYSTNVAMKVPKSIGSTSEIAEQLKKILEKEIDNLVSKVEIAGPGFVNITLSNDVVALAIAEADAKGSEWGSGIVEKGKRVIVEYSNPNAFKEMHIGHLVGTVVGEAVSRLIENAGAILARDTFGGDVGPNVAKALWGLKKKGINDPANSHEIGSAYTEGSNAYDNDPKAKEEIDALNQDIYAGNDRELMDLWRKGRDVSVGEFRRIWNILGTHFDFEFFDSDTTESGLRIVNDGLEKGIFEKSDGAVIYNGENKNVHTMVFITSHNTPTYEAKDIGLAFLREERWPSDKVIIITGNEQTGRFKTILSALSEIAPKLAEKTKHLPTGFLKLSSGKMSSRDGNVITVAQFIEDIIKKASEKNTDPIIAEQVALGAIKYMILRQAPGSDIIFDPEKSLSLEGDSGPYLQYALVRAKSVLASAEEKSVAQDSDAKNEPYPIKRIILHFPEVAERSAIEMSPNLLVNYLTELAGEWNSFYAKERIVGGENESHKLIVTRAFINTMNNGLKLLGIPAPEKM